MLHYTLLRERLLVIAVDSELGIGGTVVDLPRENLLRWAREFAGEPGSPAGRELARTLLVPVRERLGRFRRLVIVPDRVLFGIPWAALPWNDGLLVETHVTNVAPSASSYERLARRSPGRSVDPSLLVVADPSSSGRPLPEARGAALALSSLFSQSSLLLGDEASEENVAEAIADYDIVHFGTHACIEPDLPLSSSLTLSGGGGMAERSLLAPIGQDGRLTGYEVLQLSLKPGAVVTLAACETMDGGVNRELAVAGLARAFFERGARAVIATHWPVEDRGTRPLMERFYRALSAGTPEDVALGEAQVALATGQEGERFRDPYYWAGFVMMGYAAP